MKNYPGYARWVKLDTGVQRHIESVKSHFAYKPETSFHMESTVLRLIPKHEKRVIRVLNLKIIIKLLYIHFIIKKM